MMVLLKAFRHGCCPFANSQKACQPALSTLPNKMAKAIGDVLALAVEP
jgi:hypothetical protein